VGFSKTALVCWWRAFYGEVDHFITAEDNEAEDSSLFPFIVRDSFLGGKFSKFFCISED
jgi:hypothetical protein